MSQDANAHRSNSSRLQKTSSIDFKYLIMKSLNEIVTIAYQIVDYYVTKSMDPWHYVTISNRPGCIGLQRPVIFFRP
jgi:hypothetical protein